MGKSNILEFIQPKNMLEYSKNNIHILTSYFKYFICTLIAVMRWDFTSVTEQKLSLKVII